MNLLLEHTEANKIILGFEIIIFIIGIILITVSLLRNNQAQAGLSALNGGNEELFLNRKERGLDRLLSQIIFWLGISFILISTIIAILTGVYL